MPVGLVKEDESHAIRESVFVLTVMWLDENGREPEDRKKRRVRTWGWFPTLALAEESVTANHGDMYEDGYYNTAVLEEMPWGPLATARAEHWYRADPHWTSRSGPPDHYDVHKMAKPDSLKNVCSWGMG